MGTILSWFSTLVRPFIITADTIFGYVFRPDLLIYGTPVFVFLILALLVNFVISFFGGE